LFSPENGILDAPSAFAMLIYLRRKVSTFNWLPAVSLENQNPEIARIFQLPAAATL
jgi:hypothetical protein